MAEFRRRHTDLPPERETHGWFNDLSLSIKAALTFGGLVAVAVMVGAAFLVAQSYTHRARDDAQSTYETLSVAENLEVISLNLLRLLRAAADTRQPQYLDQYRATLAEYDDSAARLWGLVQGDAAQQIRVARLDDVMAQWQASAVAPLLDLLLDPARSVEFERNPAIASQMIVAVGAPIDAVGQLLDDFMSAERKNLGQRNQAADRANQIAAWTAGGGALVGLLAGWVGLRTARGTVIVPLDRLTGFVSHISSGHADVEIPYTGRRDEIGAFARALTTLQEVVQARALQNWVKTQVSKISTALQSCATHEQFGQTLLRGLCGALGSPYGLAYRWDEDSQKLWWCAAYGLPDDPVGPPARFAAGVGLAGQALVDCEMIVVRNVKPEHFRFVTGAGFSQPASILFLPLVTRGEVIAVLEIGLFGEPRDDLREFLDEIARNSALAWQTLARSLRTLELLGTTQVQAEELQASHEATRTQQEELRATNETLRERTQLLEDQQRRLRASEEELRAQAEELQEANRALRERGDELRQRREEVEKAKAELERRAHALEEASRYKSEFLANMSHELRTPLNSLLILSKGLADNEEGNLSADQVESAKIVFDSGRNLLTLINDILDLSKVEAGKMQLVLEDVNLQAFSRMQERNFRHVAQSRGLRFDVVLEEGLPETIHTDGTRLGQIIVNLLSNAFKFTQEGSVSLAIGRPTSGFSACMKGMDASQALYFAVSDTGIGIDQDRIEQVFLPFEQAEGSTSRRFGGTGLGLPIALGMAQLLGGEIQVRSEPGVGSIFTLLVPDHLADDEAAHRSPLPRDAAAEPLPARVSANGPGGGHRVPGPEAAILIVEDDPSFAAVLSGIVSRKGCAALRAASGAEALEIAYDRPLSAVLLDLGLPDMSGWDVLERLKNHPATRDVPVHIISARDESPRGLEMGAIGFLVKPVSREAVLQVLEQVTSNAARGLRRILLVDDDPMSRHQVHQLLEREPVDIVDAVDGAGGLAAMAENPPFDGVILDLGLPDMSGFEWLERLARRGEVPPVVIYSARELTPDENLRLRAYTESIVIKGVRSPERLLDEVSLFLHAIRPAAPAAQPAATEPPAEGLAGKTVLVVDDDMRNVFALSKALRNRGLKVLMAQDGFKALSQLEANPDVNIVLMDIMMPGMDGYETMRRIRQQPQWKDLPIIAVTAKAMKGDREKCLEAGACDYCSKPIDIDQLMSQIRVWA